jgi:hypothetical protein
MIQSTSTVDTYLFRVSRLSYVRTRLLGLLWLGGFFSCACLALLLSAWLLPTYDHTFTLYLKWQDALVALLWAIALFSLIGCVFSLRFLYALYIGYTRGMFTLVKDKQLAVRDLSPENIVSGFWMMHASFWCCVTVLVGLLPAMLLAWTVSIANPILMVLATGGIIVLGVAGLVLSITFGSFVVIGCFGAITFCRNLGAERTYALNDHTILRLDGTILTIIYPGKPESMVDLASLDTVDQQYLLALLDGRLDIQHPREELEAEVPIAVGYDAVPV